MIEIITKQPFEAAFKDIVLKPLGLETAYFVPADVMTRRFVVDHAGTKGIGSIGGVKVKD